MQPTTVQALEPARQLGRRKPGLLAALTSWARRSQARAREFVMAAVSHPDPAASIYHDALARQAATSVRRAALFASGLQRSDAPAAVMAAEAITATVRRLGVRGCVSRMAQEFGDHPDAAAERMRWIHQLVAEMPTWLRMPTDAGGPTGRAGNDIEARSGRWPELQ
jgi:hypothetical protein